VPRSLVEPYYPHPAPDNPADLNRYIYLELIRIAEAIRAQPVALTVMEADDYTVGSVPAWTQVFLGADPDWDVPGGNFDPITGDGTCSQSGLYTLSAQLEVEPYGSGNKNYYAGIQVRIDRDAVITIHESTDGGVDNIPLGVSLSGQVPLLAGDIVSTYIDIVHETFTGVAPYEVNLQLLRVSEA